MSRRISLSLAACGFAGVLLLSGCGSQGSTTAASPSPSASPSPARPTFTGPAAEFCNGFLSLGLSPEQVQEQATGGPEGAKAAAEALVEQLETLEQNLPEGAPKQVRAALTTFANGIRSVGQGKSPDAETTAAVQQAESVVIDYVGKTCTLPSGSPSPS